jgi:hypothetical protein
VSLLVILSLLLWLPYTRATTTQFLKENWGSIAALGDVALSLYVVVIATGARKAAMEARQAVRKGNAAEEFKNLSEIANEFLSHIEADQVPAALIRARDLMSAMSLASRRWGRFLSVDSRNNFEEAYAQVSIISRSLSSNGPAATPQQKEKMLKICHGVV